MTRSRVDDKPVRGPRHSTGADNTDKQGVGLGGAWQLVELLDGTIGVASEVGVGTYFIVGFPAAAATWADPLVRG